LGLGTAAFNAPEGAEKFFPAGTQIPGKEHFRGEYLPCFTVGAAFHPGLGKARRDILVFHRLGVSFKGDDLAAVDPEGGDEAGRGYGAVKAHQTASAGTGKAAAFGGQKSKVFPQYGDEPFTGLGKNLHVFAV
jgi:hypothetical protein